MYVRVFSLRLGVGGRSQTADRDRVRVGLLWDSTPRCPGHYMNRNPHSTPRQGDLRISCDEINKQIG